MKKILFSSLILFSVLVSFAQSDDCSGATTLTAGSTCVTQAFTNNENGQPEASTPNPSCMTGTEGSDTWYQFTGTGNSMSVTLSGANTNSTLAIWSNCPATTQVACANITAGSSGTLTIASVLSTVYYVQIIRTSGAANDNQNGNICLVDVPSLPAGAIVMSNGNTSACSGTFYDPGGLSNYADNIPVTVMTICPSTAGAKLQAAFSAFQTESTTLDYLEIFDGNSVAAPSLGVYGGTTSPGTIQASASNVSGCLTFRFRSDVSINYLGWVATLSCIIPCQTITANFVSSNEAPAGDGIVRICQGESVNLVGSGTFGTSGTGATYAWSMGNGVTVSGANINYTYPAVGSYLANLIVTDPNGCTNSNALNRQIQVSTTPTISTSATPSTLCTNQTSALAATVTMTPFVINCTPPVSGTTFLPDGTGVSYSTSITTNCYSPAAVVTAATDITNICLNMEHSYSGDLSLAIQCPNGQTVNLLTYPSGNGSANLGTPWATSTVDGSSTTTTPGVGANYCFSMTGGTTWTSGALSGGTFVSGNGPGTYTDTYMPAGTYTPQQSFAGLIGCPLNGNWTIQVTDNLGSDNGYIFNWDINFAASFSTASSFTPTIVSQGWLAATTLTNVNATSANVTPTNQGAPCFTYSVTDNFGCTYTAPQCITVNCGTSLPVELTKFEANAVSNERVHLLWETSSETNSDYFNIERSIDGESWELLATVDAAGTSVETLNYSTVDENPYNGTSYYRLSQYDLNGALGTTDMEAVYLNFAEGAELILFPNPTTSLVSVKGDLVSLSTFQILNNLGQNVRGQVKTYSQSDGSLVLDVSELAAGIYTVKGGAKAISLVKE